MPVGGVTFIRRHGAGGERAALGFRYCTPSEYLANPWPLPIQPLSNSYPTSIGHLSDTGRMRENHASKTAKRCWQWSHKDLLLSIRTSV